MTPTALPRLEIHYGGDTMKAAHDIRSTSIKGEWFIESRN